MGKNVVYPYFSQESLTLSVYWLELPSLNFEESPLPLCSQHLLACLYITSRVSKYYCCQWSFNKSIYYKLSICNDMVTRIVQWSLFMWYYHLRLKLFILFFNFYFFVISWKWWFTLVSDVAASIFKSRRSKYQNISTGTLPLQVRKNFINYDPPVKLYSYQQQLKPKLIQVSIICRAEGLLQFKVSSILLSFPTHFCWSL